MELWILTQALVYHLRTTVPSAINASPHILRVENTAGLFLLLEAHQLILFSLCIPADCGAGAGGRRLRFSASTELVMTSSLEMRKLVGELIFRLIPREKWNLI